MRTIIAGSRNIEDYQELRRAIKHLTWPITEVVSGHATSGVDLLGERWAKRNDIPLTLFPANWERYGKAAGSIRNRQMAEYSQALLALWDGKSPGTKDMIKQARQRNLKVRVYLIGQATLL
jgi:hypothetical protein